MLAPAISREPFETIARRNAQIGETLGRVQGDQEWRDKLVRATATRQIPAPAEIADVVTFLCSPRAAAVTGTVVEATAGGHLNNLW